MKIRSAVFALAFVAASPALAWSGSTQAGDYRVTATLDGKARLQSVSLAPEAGIAARPMQLHAWYVDGDGAILAPARLANASSSGPTLVALGSGSPVPATATALVVLAEPDGLTRASTAQAPAIVAQIALP